ncbi:alpha/beta hydrolase [Paenibacillus woosongensis]|uniref:Alpha/beta fold hydrolase n=1 Tax=Paenibacillus woosongensis TaxID=307580 RepID=A0A7X3CMX4_9BACL|nr:alpha/beta fold hydrolase [Paenibacillus woosongensis]MUG45284.1 alpha/beta fold hydrolase [Paenibacillus woosongensis]
MELPVTILNDGKELFGVYHTCSKPKATVIICHGLGGTRTDVHRICLRFARALVQNGYSCLRIDLTGSGISQGEFYEFTISQSVKDIDQSIRYVQQNFGADQIHLLGFSDGAFIAYQVALQQSYIKGLIFWSPTFKIASEDTPRDSLNQRLHRVGSRMVWPVLGHWVHHEYFQERNGILKELNFGKLDRDCLFIYGGKDEEVARGIRQIDHFKISKVEIAECDHHFLSNEWTEQVIASSISWLESKYIL